MQVILLKSVDRLGEKDDIVSVKNGFGRNFLIPQKKAIIASKSAKKVRSENILQRTHKLEKIKENAKTLANQLTGIFLQIKVKISPTGTIFGSVTVTQIADELAKKGFEIEKKSISIQDHIKEIGFYQATLKLCKDIVVKIPFEVTATE